MKLQEGTVRRMSEPHRQIIIRPDHPLVGTWVTEEEDSRAAFVISVSRNKFRVSGFSRPDGEAFKITQLKWDGRALSFTARMPSTGWTTRNVLRLRRDGNANLEITLFEIWKKKDVKPREPPEGWTRQSQKR